MVPAPASGFPGFLAAASFSSFVPARWYPPGFPAEFGTLHRSLHKSSVLFPLVRTLTKLFSTIALISATFLGDMDRGSSSAVCWMILLGPNLTSAAFAALYPPDLIASASASVVEMAIAVPRC